MPILPPTAPGVVAASSQHYIVTPSCGISEQQGNDAIQDTGGFVDMTDRLRSVDINFSMDNPVGSATVVLALGRGLQSLSPLITPSYRNNLGARAALRPHNAISLNFGVGYPNGGSLNQFGVFAGRIDRVTLTKDTATLACRDWGAYLQETSLRETVMYGNGSLLAEQVMAQMLEDTGWGALTLNTLGTNDFVIYPTPFGQISLLDAMRTMAQQIGWDLRWFPPGWNNVPLGVGVNFYDPGRDRVIYDAQFTAPRYRSIDEVAWGDEDVRNDWNVYYQDPTTALPVGPIHVEDRDSIEQYSRRKAQIYLQRAENIRDDTHALAFANAALADNKDPFVSHRVRMPLYPNVTLNDLHLYSGANVREYDRDLVLAVVGYQHHWESTPNTQPWTTIAARGKPLAAYRDYRRSVPPKTIVTTAAPTDQYAPEGTLILVTDSLA